MDAELNQCWSCKKEGKFHCEKCNLAFYCSDECVETDQLRHCFECARATIQRLCIACGCHRTVLQRCASCFQAYYCNKTCQIRHWSEHSKHCKKFQKNVIELAEGRLEKPFFRERSVYPWYVGTFNAEDYLRLHQNEGKSTDRALRLLFVGVGDIKDVVLTVARLPSEFRGSLNFVLNDSNPHVSARSLLFLYCAIVEPVAENLVQIWYSLRLTPTVLRYVVAKLKVLIAADYKTALAKMRNLVNISADHWDKCLHIWKSWNKVALDPDAAEKMMNVRSQYFSRPNESHAIKEYSKSIPEEHLESTKDYIKNGLLLPVNSSCRRDAEFPNCTMTYNNRPCYHFEVGPYFDGEANLYPEDEMTYLMPNDTFVLFCWDYVDAAEFGKKDDVLEMYLTYLEVLLNSCIEKIGHGSITFNFVIDDFQNLDSYLPVDACFDRISVSNLSDFYLHPLMLKQFGPRLNRANTCSVLITCHVAWFLRTHVLESASDLRDKLTKRFSLEQLEMLAEAYATHKSAGLIMDTFLIDCADTYPSFLQVIASEAVAYSTMYENLHLNKKLIKHPDTYAKSFGLSLPNNCSYLNHVVPFQRPCISRLTSSYLNGFRRYLEWSAHQPV